MDRLWAGEHVQVDCMYAALTLFDNHRLHIHRFLYSFSAKSQFPIVWIVFAGLSLLTCVQGWTLRLHRTDSEPSDDTPKDSRSELGQAGYGAVNSDATVTSSTGKDGSSPAQPIFTVHQAKTRAEWLECVAIRIEGKFESSHVLCAEPD